MTSSRPSLSGLPALQGSRFPSLPRTFSPRIRILIRARECGPFLYARRSHFIEFDMLEHIEFDKSGR